MKKVLAHGTFDIMHYGHLNYLEKAKSYGDYLIVLLSSDDIVKKEKGRFPYFNEEIRKRFLSSLKCVNEVIIRRESFSKELIEKLKIDVYVTIYPQKEDLSKICKVQIVERTQNISTSQIKEYLKKKKIATIT